MAKSAFQWRELFIPTLDAKAVVIMGTCSILLYFLDPNMRGDFHFSAMRNEFNKETGTAALIYCFMALSYVVAIFSLNPSQFTTRDQKDLRVQNSMVLYFGVAWSLIVGLNAATVGLDSVHGVFVIFPIMNIVSAFAMLWILDKDSPETQVLNKHSRIENVFVGLVISSVVVYLGVIWLKVHWSITLSMAVAYAESVDSQLQRLAFMMKKDFSSGG